MHTYAIAGGYTVTAAYNGAANFTTSSGMASLTINPLPPTVTAVAPNGGSSAGGTAVTITGTNFTGATGVKFGANSATNVTVVSATSITATSPSGPAGIVDVTVTTPSGTSATSAADAFVYSSAPAVTAVSPNGGPPAGGTTVLITGFNFTGATAVKFGAAAAASFIVISATAITATSPAGAIGAVDVTVTTSQGSQVGRQRIQRHAAPGLRCCVLC